MKTIIYSRCFSKNQRIWILSVVLMVFSLSTGVVAANSAGPTPTVDSLLKDSKPSVAMQESDCSKPEERPENVAKISASVEKQKKMMEPVLGVCDLLLVGDSLTAGWKQNPEAWNALVGDLKAVNTGVGGETIQGMLYRIQQFPVELKPKCVTVLCGANNPTYTVNEIAAGTVALVSAIRQKWPDCKVILISLTPRGPGLDDTLCAKTAAVNKLTSAIADGDRIRYLDLWRDFVYRGENQGFVGIRFEPKDKLHLTAEGYDLFAKALAPLLKK